MKDDFKEELAFIINSKISRLNFRTTRAITRAFPFLNLMLLNRINSYNIDCLKTDKLLSIINLLDEAIHNRVFGFRTEFNIEKKSIKLSYLGQL